MIVDVHGHTVAPPELYEYMLRTVALRGTHGRAELKISDDRLRETLAGHLAMLDRVGTDIQFISPRPFSTLHGERPAKVVHWVTETTNDVIARQVTLAPTRLRGIAGLPQAVGTTADEWTGELRRCVKELGFVGALINPDPAEGIDSGPPMGDPSWFPLYEALVELDVPGIVHGGGCRSARESYSNHFITEQSIAVLSIIEGGVFERYPALKLVICHGGGSVPYQVDRWRALRWRHWRPALDMSELDRAATDRVRAQVRNVESFDDSLRRLSFDTVLYGRDSLELLFKVVGPDRCLFGTEMPGTGSSVDPNTGRWMDDLRPVIEGIEWLSAADREAIFTENARRLFPAAFPATSAAARGGGAA